MQVKKGDKVKVLAGKDKGKSGVITKVMPKENRVVVDGINILKRHQKAKKQGEKGVMIEVSSPIHASNVAKI